MLILLVILVVLVATGPWYPYSREWGYGPSGLLTVVLLVLILLALTGRLRL